METNVLVRNVQEEGFPEEMAAAVIRIIWHEMEGAFSDLCVEFKTSSKPVQNHVIYIKKFIIVMFYIFRRHQAIPGALDGSSVKVYKEDWPIFCDLLSRRLGQHSQFTFLYYRAMHGMSGDASYVLDNFRRSVPEPEKCLLVQIHPAMEYKESDSATYTLDIEKMQENFHSLKYYARFMRTVVGNFS